ncbi:hypothetical protein [Thalassospira lucentensis]|uniref:hypothetical protein n=1 Tax=Thalassospira lucentensis TaxID=168935 RepID=UPI00142E0A89|nr:hypothetical protein [Thalassospira lucentensis]NIZ00151.1 hypothetical protein [Thalassospira lucentensis]
MENIHNSHLESDELQNKKVIFVVNKQKIILIYEDKKQINSDCFIKQLHIVLKDNFDLQYVSANDLINGEYNTPPHGVKMLSVLRLRSWRPLLPYLAKISETSELYMYDQDPWEAYHDNGACRGIYELLQSLIRVESFLVTSKWWCDHIANQTEATVKFVRMGAIPQNCDPGKPFTKRKHEIGFQGTVHPHRQKFFDELEKTSGLHTEILERVDFETFLKTVQEVGIYLYDDHASLTVQGEPTSFHGLWGKCLTVAGRGCFVIRNDDLSRAAYNIDEIPTVFPYKDRSEIPKLVEHIRRMPEEERWRRMNKAVEIIKNRQDWQTVVSAINA